MDNDDTLLNNRGPQPGAETVYGTDDNNMVMSEKKINKEEIPKKVI
ncbi:JNK-interacting protein 3 [Lucilia cuprina]|nr:JNK-interacting protein 3 [Lucilia cuprina]